MNTLRVISIILGLTICHWSSAQEQKLMSVIGRLANELAEESTDTNAELLTEMLFDLAAEPVFINRGDQTDISRLFFLTTHQIETIVSYIRRTGPVVSLLELASLPGFNRQTAEMMMPFISLDITPASAYEESSPRLWNRVVATAGIRYIDGSPGTDVNPFRNSTRYRMNSGNLSASLTAASDAGEQPLWSGRPDFITGGIAITNSNITGNNGVISFIAGDYTARFGMGLVVNSGYRPFLTLTGTSFMGHRDGFIISSSINENNYLRGAAVTASRQNLKMSLFISSRYRDARLLKDASGVEYADILSTPPVHGSLSGLSAAGVLRETSAGISVGLGKGDIRWTLTACHTNFSREVREGVSGRGEMYGFIGTGNFNAGASYRFARGRMTGAGELAFSGDGIPATAHTVNIRFDDRLTGSLIYRYYSKGYYGHLAGGPGRNTRTCNEEGLMARVMYEAARGLFLHAGADVYRHPWLKSSVSAPSHGFRAEVKAIYEIRSGFTAELRIYGGETWKNSSMTARITGPASGGVPPLTEVRQTTMRMTVTGSPALAISFRAHALYKRAGDDKSGSMLACDAVIAPSGFPLSVWIRQAMFTTGDFDSGLYLYENDMLYGFSIPVHHGEGSRTALIVNAVIGEKADLRIKYGLMRKYPKESNPATEEIKVQISLRF